MALRWLLALALLALVTLVGGQRYDDYDYQDIVPAPRPRPSAPAPRPAPKPAAPKVAPVAILKQINRHNDDGSYTYGYEGADGSFKIETKSPNGDVKGKYGFVDDSGRLRTVDYGADRYGFQPSGEGITVPPPTLVDESVTEDYYRPRAIPAAAPVYRPAPQQQEAPVYRPRPAPGPPPSAQRAYSQRPAPPPPPQHHQFAEPPSRAQFQAAPRPAPRPAPPPQSFRPAPSAEDFAPAPAPRPAPRPQQHFAPAPVAPRAAPQPSYSVPVTRAAPSPSSSSRGSGGFLDQLARDYALPSDAGAALHDISFGYY